MPGTDDLDGWIDVLRERLQLGDLADLGPIDVGSGTNHLQGETTIRVMLADLADLADPMGSWDGDLAWREERRRDLLDNFRRLRELLG